MKQTFDIETQTGEHVESSCTVNIDQVELGKRMVFIPESMGVYLPISMVDTNKTFCERSNKTFASYKNNYFLDMGSLDGKTRDLVK